MKRRLSIAFHPQTDGATERQNQTLEIFLKAYINYHQDNWARLFAPAQYRLNNCVNKITGRIPFNIIYRYEPMFRINPAAADSEISGKTPDTRQQIETREINNKIYKKLWERAQETAKNYYNVKKKPRIFKIGDEILL